MPENIKASKLIYGTMRMKDCSSKLAYWVDFFENLIDLGVSHLHVSKDYTSYNLLCRVLKEINRNNLKKEFNVTVKLPEPDFNNLYFDNERFRSKINSYLDDLKVDKIYNLQWIWRSQLKNDTKRIKIYNNSINQIKETVNNCKSDNKIKYFYCFPYTQNFANVDKSIFDGFMVYFNPIENEFLEFIKKTSLNKKIITIRPFFGGKLSNNKKYTLRSLLDFQFRHEIINGIVYTFTKKQHILELKKYLND